MGITRENRVLNQINPKIKYEPKAEIATGMFLPNHSGINSHPEVKENLVPYTGANANVNLGTKSLTATGVTDSSLTASKPVFTDANKKLSSSGTVPIANGGTNSTSFTTNTIPYYNGTSIVSDTDLNFDGDRTMLGAGSFISGNKFQIYKSNTDYTNTGGANAHMVFNNPSSTGQSTFMNLINGTMRSKWRTDFVGNVSWVANGGVHNFYVGGDYGTGTDVMDIYSNYVNINGSLTITDGSIASPAIEDAVFTSGYMGIGDPFTYWYGTSIFIEPASDFINIRTSDLQINDNSGYSGTITTAKLTAGGANGSMTFTNGILTASTAAT